ncbi:Protein-S-isoprenylcysteine O-methyltransferase Ste14 [Microbacterium sp. ru370.1]|uniref:methyltransferase family protein n=1 Tax=unclassified Microbacterium TaxID=2609290 RepID=UPI000890EE2F|nr:MULTISPECIES: methyltransferase [unclassified Microbacterium]SDO77222.1 Protein-S-isoprenylcysteine O-methyltransferase Ste14 [Microbacterium sp. ru370.1]SIT88795.1 Protein-S-isoprenylcysteine O-methyltransferase Ste14 [Microbacterium sp. RU1D]
MSVEGHSGVSRRMAAETIGRVYFALQAVTGAGWWVSVFTVPVVRETTLGALDPVVAAVFDIPLFVVASALAAVLPGRGSRWAAAAATAWTLLVTALLGLYATVTTLAGVGVILMIAASVASAGAWLLLAFGHIPTAVLLVGPFRFRRARPRATPVAHMIATAAQIVVFWGLFLVVFPLIIRALEERWRLMLPVPDGVVVAGVAVVVAASALGLWSAAAMTVEGDGTPLPSAMPNRLVIAGPYRFVRNPMALAGIAQGAGVGLLMSSWMVVVYALAGSLVWNYAIRPHEEADLARVFGDDYRAYARAARCWVPRLRPVGSGG